MEHGFIFSGQGAQAVGMGKDLYERSATARKIFDTADNVLGWKVSELCFNGPEEKLTESKYCQPAIFTMSCACLEVFREKFPFLIPFAVAGLSLGEFGALYCAGVFKFEDGLRLVARRGELMDEACCATKGAMASILGSDEETVKKVCAEADVDMANLNCPGQIVISGEEAKIQIAIEKLKAIGVKKIIPLKVAGAYHSRLMSGAGAKFAEELAKFAIAEPKCAVAQNVVGGFVRSAEEIRKNLAAQVSGSVLWEKCVRAMIAEGIGYFIEFGPGNVLTGLIKRISPEIKTYNINSIKTLEEFLP